MNEIRVGREFRSLNDIIRRHFEFSSHQRETETVTDNNGWTVSLVTDRADQDIYQKDTENYFTITRSTTSRALSLMKRKGLIERQTVIQDAYLKKIVLTPKALGIQGLMLEDIERVEYTLIQGFTEKGVKTLLSYSECTRTSVTNLQEEQ